MSRLIAAVVATVAFTVPMFAFAATPQYDVSGNWVFNFNYGGSYPHEVTLAQDASGNVTGSGGYPVGGPYSYTWIVTSGSVSGNGLSLTADYTGGPDAVTPQTTMHISGTIAADGTISGTWDDNYQGGSRTGTWSSASGSAAPIIPACSLDDTTFDTFINGSVNGQHGWVSTGAVDQAIVPNTYGISTFGCKTLRISDAVTSGSFGDQTFSYSTANEAGEAVAENGGMSGGTRQTHFEAQFDLASALAALQPGMHMSVSPDRGDGARMSYLRFEDQAEGIHVFFDDVTSATHLLNSDVFNESDIATITRAPHTIKFVMDFVNGPDNDVVKIYIDGALVKTGTSWEDYYRFDSESNPVAPSDTSRTVDSLLFRESGTANPADAGNGFLVDNVMLTSNTPMLICSAAPAIATAYMQSKGIKGGSATWKTVINDVSGKTGKNGQFWAAHACDAGYPVSVTSYLYTQYGL